MAWIVVKFLFSRMEYWWIPVSSAIIGAAVVASVEYLSRAYVVWQLSTTSKDVSTQSIYEIWTRFDPLKRPTQTESSKVSTTTQAKKSHSTQETATQTEEVSSTIKPTDTNEEMLNKITEHEIFT